MEGRGTGERVSNKGANRITSSAPRGGKSSEQQLPEPGAVRLPAAAAARAVLSASRTSHRTLRPPH